MAKEIQAIKAYHRRQLEILRCPHNPSDYSGFNAVPQVLSYGMFTLLRDAS
jgi:hypothetical protein